MKKKTNKNNHHLLVVIYCLMTFQLSFASLLNVVNGSFEDTSGQIVSNEFTFGTPAGWSLYDPHSIVPHPGTYVGTLEPNGVDFFNSTAPDGNKVSILFNSGLQGAGEYGFEQTLSDVLMANTAYNLDVEIGNIASGFAQNGIFYNLDNFPGYRIDILAGGTVIAQDINSLVINEGEFLTSNISFVTGSTHAQLGQHIGIRLVNLNEIPSGYTLANAPDAEVDFDNIVFTSALVPEPSTYLLTMFGLICFGLFRKVKK